MELKAGVRPLKGNSKIRIRLKLVHFLSFAHLVIAFYFQKQEGNKAKKKKTSQGDLACFNIDDTIMAKMKSSSTWDAAWPARIETKKDKGYDVYFFGFGSRSFIRPGNIRPYLGSLQSLEL